MKKIIATVGPSLLYKTPINKIDSDKIIYRINGAHGDIDDIKQTIIEIRKQLPNAKILMDLPGNKVRTANFENGFIDIENNKKFSISFSQTNYKNFYKHINIGDTIFANDSIFEFEIDNIDTTKEQITFLSKSTGRLLNNKGIHLRGLSDNLPFLFEKDYDLIKLANQYNLEFLGLSFVRDANDIKEVKKLANIDIKIISKVETRLAVKNLNSILQEVEYILIDRGDLSSEIGITKVASYQKYIIDKAHFFDTKIFLATQFLKNMEHNPIPTIPESIDLYNTIKMGIYGIQMSEETAVGSYPVESIKFIESMIDEIENQSIDISNN